MKVDDWLPSAPGLVDWRGNRYNREDVLLTKIKINDRESDGRLWHGKV